MQLFFAAAQACVDHNTMVLNSSPVGAVSLYLSDPAPCRCTQYACTAGSHPTWISLWNQASMGAAVSCATPSRTSSAACGIQRQVW